MPFNLLKTNLSSISRYYFISSIKIITHSNQLISLTNNSIALLTLLRFVHFHRSFVNNGLALQTQIESQLLNNTKISYS